MQQQSLAVQFGHSRFVYNRMLETRIDEYKQKKKGLSYGDTARMLTKLKRSPDFEWLKKADSQVLQQSLRDLDQAYKNFFAKRGSFPRFKSRLHKQSIRYPQRVKAIPEEKQTYFPKVGWVKTKFHRPIEGKIKNVTVSRTKSGRYFASFQVEMDIPDPSYVGKRIGLDLGVNSFAAFSDGTKVANPRHLLKTHRKLRRLQKRLSRSKRGSKGREKARLAVAKQHEKVANQRKDFHHQLTAKLVQENRLIAVEDLHVKGMVKNKHLAKHISDAGWSEFLRQLHYKGAWYGCDVVSADRWFPSSKTCSVCNTEIKQLPLNVRQWQCPICHAQHDRDVNAAINILNQTTVGVTECRKRDLRKAGGVRVRPVSLTAGWDREAGSPSL